MPTFGAIRQRLNVSFAKARTFVIDRSGAASYLAG
jgi:hypothetical protein